MFGRPWVRVGVVCVVAVVAGLGVWLAVRNGDTSGSSNAPSKASSSTADVSARSLRALGAQLGRPVYWAGRSNGVTYEFTETADRRAYVRYLPAGVSAGSPKSFLTVGTYPVANAFAVTSAAARRTGRSGCRWAGAGSPSTVLRGRRTCTSRSPAPPPRSRFSIRQPPLCTSSSRPAVSARSAPRRRTCPPL